MTSVKMGSIVLSLESWEEQFLHQRTNINTIQARGFICRFIVIANFQTLQHLIQIIHCTLDAIKVVELRRTQNLELQSRWRVNASGEAQDFIYAALSTTQSSITLIT